MPRFLPGTRWGLLPLLLLTFPLAGCDSFRACTAIFVWGISVEMTPELDVIPPGGTAFGWVEDGTYVDSLRLFFIHPDDGVVLLNAAGERSGEYAVTVQRAGFRTWDTSGVRVRHDGCHVVNVQLDVDLEPLP